MTVIVRTYREKYVGGPTNSVTRKELGALFDVTGTPSWRDVEGVQSATWRNYLQRLPGRAPTLYRRIGYAGERSNALWLSPVPALLLCLAFSCMSRKTGFCYTWYLASTSQL